MKRRIEDGDVSAWIVVADVLSAFVAVLFLVILVRMPALATPPPAKDELAKDLAKDRSAGGIFVVDASGFSTVRVVYQTGALFESCRWQLSSSGEDLVTRHAVIMSRHTDAIDRVLIEGHADIRSATGCDELRRTGLRPDNWTLSSLRALIVREKLE